MDFDKKRYKQLKKNAKSIGLKVYSRKCVPDAAGYAGVSVAYVPTLNSEDCRMLEVSVSYCSPEDTFSKKIGKFQALSHWFDGATVQLPLNQRRLAYSSFKEYMLDVFTV